MNFIQKWFEQRKIKEEKEMKQLKKQALKRLDDKFNKTYKDKTLILKNGLYCKCYDYTRHGGYYDYYGDYEYIITKLIVCFYDDNSSLEDNGEFEIDIESIDAISIW